MTITLSRCRSSSMCSKNVIRRSLGRSSSEATFATAVIAAKKARLIYFPQMRMSPTASEGVAVFRQRIRGVAVPSDFPVSELFFVGEGDRTNPLRALVCVALRDEDPHRSAVFDWKRFPVPLVREENVGIVQDVEGMGRRIAVATSEGRETSRRPNLCSFRHFLDRDSDPLVVERGPTGDAVERGHHFRGRKAEQLAVREADRGVDRAAHPEVPLLRIEPRGEYPVETSTISDLSISQRDRT